MTIQAGLFGLLDRRFPERKDVGGVHRFNVLAARAMARLTTSMLAVKFELSQACVLTKSELSSQFFMAIGTSLRTHILRPDCSLSDCQRTGEQQQAQSKEDGEQQTAAPLRLAH